MAPDALEYKSRGSKHNLMQLVPYGAVFVFCCVVAIPLAQSEETRLPNLDGHEATAPDDGDTSESPRNFGRQLVYDTRYVLTAPTRWNAEDWARFGIVSAAIVGTGVLFDKRERDSESDKTNSLDESASKAEPLGAAGSALVLG